MSEKNGKEESSTKESAVIKDIMKYIPKSDREMNHICPSKLTKRELEDLYFNLLRNNLELKKEVNGQVEKIRLLSAKVQRLTNTQRAVIGKELKECCLGTKTMIGEQMARIVELKRSNEQLRDKIKMLNGRLLSTKAFLNKRSVTTGRFSSNNKSAPANQKSARSDAATQTDNSNLMASTSVNTEAEDREKLDEMCDRNECRSQIEELKEKIVNLQEELSTTHSEYSNRITKLEDEVGVLRYSKTMYEMSLENKEQDERQIRQKLMEVQGQCSELMSKLKIEESKVSELETQARASRLSEAVSRTIDHVQRHMQGAGGTVTATPLILMDSHAESEQIKSTDDSGFGDSKLGTPSNSPKTTDRIHSCISNRTTASASNKVRSSIVSQETLKPSPECRNRLQPLSDREYCESESGSGQKLNEKPSQGYKPDVVDKNRNHYTHEEKLSEFKRETEIKKMPSDGKKHFTEKVSVRDEKQGDSTSSHRQDINTPVTKGSDDENTACEHCHVQTEPLSSSRGQNISTQSPDKNVNTPLTELRNSIHSQRLSIENKTSDEKNDIRRTSNSSQSSAAKKPLVDNCEMCGTPGAVAENTESHSIGLQSHATKPLSEVSGEHKTSHSPPSDVAPIVPETCAACGSSGLQYKTTQPLTDKIGTRKTSITLQSNGTTIFLEKCKRFESSDAMSDSVKQLSERSSTDSNKPAVEISGVRRNSLIIHSDAGAKCNMCGTSQTPETRTSPTLAEIRSVPISSSISKPLSKESATPKKTSISVTNATKKLAEKIEAHRTLVNSQPKTIQPLAEKNEGSQTLDSVIRLCDTTQDDDIASQNNQPILWSIDIQDKGNNDRATTKESRRTQMKSHSNVTNPETNETHRLSPSSLSEGYESFTHKSGPRKKSLPLGTDDDTALLTEKDEGLKSSLISDVIQNSAELIGTKLNTSTPLTDATKPSTERNETCRISPFFKAGESHPSVEKSGVHKNLPTLLSEKIQHLTERVGARLNSQTPKSDTKKPSAEKFDTRRMSPILQSSETKLLDPKSREHTNSLTFLRDSTQTLPEECVESLRPVTREKLKSSDNKTQPGVDKSQDCINAGNLKSNPTGATQTLTDDSGLNDSVDGKAMALLQQKKSRGSETTQDNGSRHYSSEDRTRDANLRWNAYDMAHTSRRFDSFSTTGAERGVIRETKDNDVYSSDIQEPLPFEDNNSSSKKAVDSKRTEIVYDWPASTANNDLTTPLETATINSSLRSKHTIECTHFGHRKSRDSNDKSESMSMSDRERNEEVPQKMNEKSGTRDSKIPEQTSSEYIIAERIKSLGKRLSSSEEKQRDNKRLDDSSKSNRCEKKSEDKTKAHTVQIQEYPVKVSDEQEWSSVMWESTKPSRDFYDPTHTPSNHRNTETATRAIEVNSVGEVLDMCAMHARVCSCPESSRRGLAVFRTCSGTLRFRATTAGGNKFRRCCCSDSNDVADSGTQATGFKNHAVQHDASKGSDAAKTYTIQGSVEVSPYMTRSRGDNTENEISSMSDLPSEKTPSSSRMPTHSPGEDKETSTMTESDDTTLSEGEIIQDKPASPGEKDIEKFSDNKISTTDDSRAAASSSTYKMEKTLLAISEELARCRELLKFSKRSKEAHACAAEGCERRRVPLRKTPARASITDTYAPKCIFTLHIGTVVLSDEAVINSRDMSLVLTWQFYDQNVAMARMHGGRVVHFDFSTEYDVKLTDDFLNYMRHDEMPIMICEINKQSEPFARCFLPLRDALLHTNRRADMSLALVAGPGMPRTRSAKDPLDTGDEIGVLDLWFVMHATPRLLTTLDAAIAKGSTATGVSNRSSMVSPMMTQLTAEEELDFRLSTDLNTPGARSSATIDGLASMPTVTDDQLAAPTPLEANPTEKADKRDSNNSIEPKVSFKESHATTLYDSLWHRGSKESTWFNDLLYHNRGSKESEMLVNEVPASIRTMDQMKDALGKGQSSENSLTPRDPKHSKTSKQERQQLSLSQSIHRQREISLAASALDPLNDIQLPTKDNLSQMYVEKSDGNRMSGAKKAIEALKKMKLGKKQDKRSLKTNTTTEETQRASYLPPKHSVVDVTILWLALNDECDAMMDTHVQRLYVAYRFLGHCGAELETPVSLPKPKQNNEKCFFNFKKTFYLSDSDKRTLRRLALCRSPKKGPHNPLNCVVFTVVSEPVEDPLGLTSCEDIGYAHLYIGDLLVYSDCGDSYTDVMPVHATSDNEEVCGVLAVKVDGLDIIRACIEGDEADVH